MPVRQPVRPLASVLASTVLLLGGCGLLDDTAGDESRTLDVWLMRGSLSEDLTDGLVRDYERRNPGVEVKVTVQEWPGIDKKVTAALDSGDAPDVIEVGNTQVAQYVEAGGVRNLTIEVGDLGGDHWIPGLEEPGKIDGYQYGVPFYAANRVVIYREDLFEGAGITSPPTTREEWIEVTERLDRPGQQGIYLPGQNWYVLAGFIWDEGGELATELSGQWSGALHTPEALRGMEFYKQLQALGAGPVDSDEADPEQRGVFAEGGIAQLIDVPGAAELITEANPELTGKLGFFPIPGKTKDEPGAVFTGGSVLIIPEKAADQEEAYSFVKLATGERWQRELARTMSVVPNSTELTDALRDDPGAAAMAQGARNGHATPNSPRWGRLEADNPIKEYQTKVLLGADPATAAREASEEITRILGGRR
ncbi:extracellular solute-binding protein [Streptomyces sp. TRM43335]|uniref:Extracellular solute-binding protein n=1 Tax=Streptomyces taklimakanensis TaxID=2569853 RepID=A0A6G2BJ27_9ACTN|nr:extracellular solute-binding protein [Streptomyces taklimakanensis]MTE21892.1 extracellular solute-binding protein [Streptomyces taklimakanensis]